MIARDSHPSVHGHIIVIINRQRSAAQRQPLHLNALAGRWSPVGGTRPGRARPQGEGGCSTDGAEVTVLRRCCDSVRTVLK